MPSIPKVNSSPMKRTTNPFIPRSPGNVASLIAGIRRLASPASAEALVAIKATRSNSSRLSNFIEKGDKVKGAEKCRAHFHYIIYCMGHLVNSPAFLCFSQEHYQLFVILLCWVKLILTRPSLFW